MRANEFMRLLLQERLKAILATYGNLPLSLLFMKPRSCPPDQLDSDATDDGLGWLPKNCSDYEFLSAGSTVASMTVMERGLHFTLPQCHYEFIWLRQQLPLFRSITRIQFSIDILSQIPNGRRIRSKLWIQSLGNRIASATPVDQGGRPFEPFVLAARHHAKFYAIRHRI